MPKISATMNLCKHDTISFLLAAPRLSAWACAVKRVVR